MSWYKIVLFLILLLIALVLGYQVNETLGIFDNLWENSTFNDNSTQTVENNSSIQNQHQQDFNNDNFVTSEQSLEYLDNLVNSEQSKNQVDIQEKCKPEKTLRKNTEDNEGGAQSILVDETKPRDSVTSLDQNNEKLRKRRHSTKW